MRYFAIALVLSPLFIGCSSATDALKSDFLLLQSRVEELERTNQRLFVRIESSEETLRLVTDTLRTTALTGFRKDRIDNLEVVRVEPEAYGYNIDDSYRDNDLTYYEDESYNDEYIDIVVSNEKVQAYRSGSTDTVSSQTTTTKSQGDKKKYNPQSKVDTGTDSLNVGNKTTTSTTHAFESGGTEEAKVNSDEVIGLYKTGLEFYRANDYDQAISYFDAFLAEDPPEDYLDNALYWLGECYYGQADYATAATYFHRIVQDFPEANKVPDALLKVGLTYHRLGKMESASQVLFFLVEAYPSSEAARVAQEKLDTL